MNFQNNGTRVTMWLLFREVGTLKLSAGDLKPKPARLKKLRMVSDSPP